MPKPRILPSDKELVAMRDQGLTHQQIADEITRRTGHRVARSTVSVALLRAGEAQPKTRYEETVPWVVPAKFQAEYQLRMLRLLGRKRLGMEMNLDEEHRLDSWLEKLRSNNEIVVFCPDPPEGEPGFHYVPDENGARDHDKAWLPIRKQPVRASQLGY